MKKNAIAILDCWSICPFRWTKNKFKCAYCEDNFTETSILREHVSMCSKKHTVKDIYSKYRELPVINLDVTDASCSVCAEPYANVAQMRAHVIQHGFEFDKNHPDGVVPFSLNNESWKCVICENKFNNFLQLYGHMNEHYQHYICASCGKGYMTIPRLRRHKAIHTSGSFSCNKCGKVFTLLSARDNHRAVAHAKEPRFKCPHCDMRFQEYRDRAAHLIDAHRLKGVKYPCGHCELSFPTSAQRGVHVRTKHIRPNFSCTQCNKMFISSGELKRHMVRHTGEKNYKCSLCGASFLRSINLRNHLKTHPEVNCKLCGSVFREKTQLVSHLSAVHPELAGSSSSDHKED